MRQPPRDRTEVGRCCPAFSASTLRQTSPRRACRRRRPLPFIRAPLYDPAAAIARTSLHHVMRVTGHYLKEGEVMADHLDAPGLTSPAMDARVDITDHYAFQKPGAADRTILILNVNPLAPANAQEFRHNAVYETLIDTDGDANPDIAFRYRFTPKENGQQFVRVTRAELERPLEDGHLEHEHEEKDIIVERAPVSFGSDALITDGAHTVRFFAGFRSDPFFFDLVGFLNGLKFTGSDFFIDKNVFGIALDVPNRLL